MKRFCIFIMSLLIFGASFQSSLFVVDYHINRDFYETHCMNKNRPELDCHGKCQAKKASSKSSNLVNLVKYAFEFNILPTASADFSLQDHTVAPLRDLICDDQHVLWPNVVLSLLPDPPQM